LMRTLPIHLGHQACPVGQASLNESP